MFPPHVLRVSKNVVTVSFETDAEAKLAFAALSAGLEYAEGHPDEVGAIGKLVLEGQTPDTCPVCGRTDRRD